MPQPLGTRTVGDVITWVTEQFGDVANVQIDTPKIIRWINMAMLEICTRDSKAYQGKFTVSSVAGTGEYTYPSNLIHITMVKWGDTVMRPISFELIQQETDSAFTTEQGEPRYWSHQANLFQLWPVPNSVATISLYGAAKPADVTVAADLIPLPDKYYPRICEYVHSCAMELDEDAEGAAAKRSLFEDQVKLGQNSSDAMLGLYPVLTDPEVEWDAY
jgi:hypothetical protein